MSFRIFLITFIISSCGVKAPPIASSEDAIPSYIQQASDQLINSEVETQGQESNSTDAKKK